MTQSTTTLAKVISHTKAYGFIYPSSEIYEGLQGVYDYGPYGVLLKKRLQALWWASMTQLHTNIVGLDAAILMAPKTWKASGHLDGFHDWMVDHKESKKRYRVDVLLEERATEWEGLGKEKEANSLLEKMHALLAKEDGEGLTALLQEAKIVCPVGKTADWTPARKFNLMFATEMGPVTKEGNKVYLRPETAQGIFVNFLNVQKTTRKQLPFGIAQIGKAFRNEIIARQFIFRMREFEQMEMQFFIPPTATEQWFDYWLKTRKAWYLALGIPAEDLNVHPHEQLAHYASAAVDITYDFPFGTKEVEGIHARGDFDLQSHARFSKKKISYFDPQLGESYVPHVVETSVGSDRLFLLMLCHAFREVQDGDNLRTYLAFPPALAPIQVAIFPLFKKAPFVEKAKSILEKLQYRFSVAYEEAGSIGKRYVRQDLIGTPYCITIDHQTLEDDTVTLRERDTMAQQRMDIGALATFLESKTHIETILKKWQALV